MQSRGIFVLLKWENKPIELCLAVVSTNKMVTMSHESKQNHSPFDMLRGGPTSLLPPSPVINTMYKEVDWLAKSEKLLVWEAEASRSP